MYGDKDIYKTPVIKGSDPNFKYTRQFTYTVTPEVTLLNNFKFLSGYFLSNIQVFKIFIAQTNVRTNMG